MYVDFMTLLFFAIPIASILFFIISLIRFLSAKKQNKQTPDTYSKKQITTRKIVMIISAVLMALFLIIVIGIIWLAYMIMTNM